MENLLNSIIGYLDVEPRDMLDHIKALSKPQDLSDLQARVDCLLKENEELKAKAEEGDLLRKEVEELKNWIAAVEKEVKTARAERDKSKEVAQKIHATWGQGCQCVRLSVSVGQASRPSD